MLTLSFVLSASPLPAADPPWGSYTNRPLQLQDLVPPDGRSFSLVHEFNYIDQNQKTWFAPKDLITDGASIPMPFWSVVGGPFEGLYREAAVVHDAACCAQMSPWRDVHHMFYNAMRCSGVSLAKAKTMFFAVWAGGPRWTTLNSTMPAKCRLSPPIDPEVQAKVAQAIQARPLSIAETRAVARPFFTARAMSDADATKFVANLKKRPLNHKERYTVTFSVIQSAKFSDDAVKQTKSWIQKENPSLKEIEARADQARTPSKGGTKGLEWRAMNEDQAFFSEIPELKTQRVN